MALVSLEIVVPPFNVILIKHASQITVHVLLVKYFVMGFVLLEIVVPPLNALLVKHVKVIFVLLLLQLAPHQVVE